MAKTLLKNGIIIDGTGKERFVGNVEIADDRIAAITQESDETQFDTVIDATGKVVAPGFIDTHSHSDLELFLDPYLAPKVFQGITTELLGQDGISLAPLPENTSARGAKT